MSRIQRRLNRMFNVRPIGIFPNGDCFLQFKQRAKLWMNILLGRGPAAYIFDYEYSPKKMTWDDLPDGNIYEKMFSPNKDAYMDFVKYCAQYVKNLSNIPVEQPEDKAKPYWNNRFFSPFNSMTLYGLIAERKPTVYMEIGSGNSTKIARQAISDLELDTKIISIDPYPRAEIEAICNESLRVPAETVDIKRFAALKKNDILFVDNSHRSFQNSDVTVFFTRILPTLKSGVVYGIHDICLPFDYPQEWTSSFYNEQYLLMAYLLGGAGGDKILMPESYISDDIDLEKTMLREYDGEAPWKGLAFRGGSFWMEKA